MRISMSKTGKSFSSMMDILEKKVMKASRKGIINAGKKLLELSLPQVPLDKGPLRESGYIKVNGKNIGNGTKDAVMITTAVDTDTGTSITVDVGYDTPYALRQHEELEYHHTFGKAKYLEDPLKANLTQLMNIMTDEVKKEIK